VQDVSPEKLKQGKKADLQSNLKNINFKLSFEDKTQKRVDNEDVRQKITTVKDPYEPGKIIS